MMKIRSPQKESARGLSRTITINAPVADLYDAIATRNGIAAWWTPLISGTVGLRKEFQLGFEGLDEIIRIRVDEARKPQIVRWTVHEHSGLPEWNGTSIAFALTGSGARKTTLRFRHNGLVPQLACYGDCSAGWDHFLDSLANVAAGGLGSPFGKKP
jgi:uncharacterized protein YndB with AHSA1/START domain